MKLLKISFILPQTKLVWEISCQFLVPCIVTCACAAYFIDTTSNTITTKDNVPIVVHSILFSAISTIKFIYKVSVSTTVVAFLLKKANGHISVSNAAQLSTPEPIRIVLYEAVHCDVVVNTLHLSFGIRSPKTIENCGKNFFEHKIVIIFEIFSKLLILICFAVKYRCVWIRTKLGPRNDKAYIIYIYVWKAKLCWA